MGLLRQLYLPVSTVVLVWAAFVVPLPFFVEAPGTLRSLGEAVDVDVPGVPPLTGDYLLTAVSLRPAATFDLVRAAFVANDRVVPTTTFVPPGEDRDAYFDRQREVFADAADVAAAVGLAAAGYDIDPSAVTGEGAVIARVITGTPADGALRAGDVITAIDGVPVRTADDLGTRIRAVPAGTPLRLEVDRADEELAVEIAARAQIVDGVERPLIGVEAQTLRPRIDLPVPVEVDSGQVGGPSAGLMIGLTVYDEASEVDLAQGRRIAGTGTLSGAGVIGPIGGVELKVIGAIADAADVFVAPREQLAEAESAAAGSDLRVIGAATFADAVAALTGT